MSVPAYPGAHRRNPGRNSGRRLRGDRLGQRQPSLRHRRLGARMKGTLDIVGGNLIDAIADQPKRNRSLRVNKDRIVALWNGAQAPAEAEGSADPMIDAAA